MGIKNFLFSNDVQNHPRFECIGHEEFGSSKRSTFAFRLPHPALRGLISHYTWMFKSVEFGGAGNAKLSNGPIPMVIFSDDIKWELSWGKKQFAVRSPGVIGGQITEPVISQINDISWTLLIELFPVAIDVLLDVSVLELEDQFVSLNDISYNGIDHLVDRIRHKNSVDDQVQELDEYFLGRFFRHRKAKEKACFYHKCISPLYSSSGTLLIQDLQKKVGLSKRQFERKFREHVGLSACVMKRMIRSNDGLTGIIKDMSIEHILDHLKYFDQSHFIKDIRWYTGMTPGALRKHGKNKFFRIGLTSYIHEYNGVTLDVP